MINLEEIDKHLSTFFPPSEGETNTIVGIDGNICINGLCPLPIKASVHFDRTNSINILDENSSKMGEIHFFDKSDSQEISSLPYLSTLCFLIDNPFETIQDSQHTFINDYAIIELQMLQNYLDNYKQKSSVWGSYFHIEDLPNNFFSITKSYSDIVAIKDVKIDKPFYLDTLELIIVESNPFNRFLKLYHLLEMQFDMHTAEKINDLLTQGNKELEISRTLKDYNREDIERLKSLFSIKLERTSFIPLLDNILVFKTKADSIYYDYGKESNPIKSKRDFDSIFALGSFNEDNINKTLGNNRFNDIIPKLIAYWIYRIRSSIAHNKLGEYLMTVDDEEFIVEFAEPLIREIIIQCYKS